MVDWRLLSKQEQESINDRVINDALDDMWALEVEGIIEEIHQGNYCADCWRIYYNCLCSHDE